MKFTAAQVQAIRDKVAGIACVDSLGLQLLEAVEGCCRLSAKLDPRFGAIFPGFHGGMLAMVADCAAWFAIVTVTGPHEPLLTTNLNISYLAPCLTDVVVESRVIKVGRTLCPTQVDLFDTAGKPVATATVTYIRLNNLKNGAASEAGAS